MKALVTGGAGFIGSHICELLKHHNYDVYSLDDLSAGYAHNIPSGVHDVRCDVTDYCTLSALFINIKPDVVFHQAASKKTVCDKDPKRDLQVNIGGAFNIAKLCFEYEAKLVHASTGSVYGEAIGIQDEDHPLNPVSYYGVSKMAGEKYVSLFGTMGLKYCILRYFHVFGERQESGQHGGVVAIWRKALEENKAVTIFGDGTQQRSFTYVKDVAEANLKAVYREGIYNCASGYSYTLNDLVGELKNIYGDVKTIYGPWQKGDVKVFRVNNKKISSFMQRWTTLREGLNDYIGEY